MEKTCKQHRTRQTPRHWYDDYRITLSITAIVAACFLYGMLQH